MRSSRLQAIKRFALLLALAAVVPLSSGCLGRNVETGDREPAVARDGRSIAYVHDRTSGWLLRSTRSEIYVYSEGHEPKRIATFDGAARLLSWSPDGSRIVFSDDGGSPRLIYVVNADGTDLRLLNPDDVGSEWAPSWSPDGEMIAFRHVTDGIVLVDAAGRHRRRLLRDGDLPAWSPDGSKIAYVAGFLVGTSLVVFDVAAESRRTLVAGRSLQWLERPSWSHDGKTLAFAAAAVSAHGDRWERMEIYSINVDGTRFRRLTNNQGLDRSPGWRPDGSIVFESEPGGARQIYTMNSDGTGVRPFFSATRKPTVRANSCLPGPLGRNAPTLVLIVPRLIRKGTRGAVILSKQLYVSATVPCPEQVEGAIVDPAYLQGRIAKRDIFPGQQLAVSQFSDPDKAAAVVDLATCPPGGEFNPVPALLPRNLIRKGTRGSVILHQRLYVPTTLACFQRWKGAIVDPAYLKGRIAKRDIFVGQQLTRSQFDRL